MIRRSLSWRPVYWAGFGYFLVGIVGAAHGGNAGGIRTCVLGAALCLLLGWVERRR